MPVVGTAGHVDHGKSSLVEALTGTDPDRWAEEKIRGVTIDLGFAWTTLENRTEISFVDVPGHERYLKNMLAGIEMIDMAMLVVAADEGWMPQTEEHMAVLDLLSVERGFVALTKIDLVDDDVIELATLEIEERLAGTTLEGSRIIAVSSLTGTGLEAIRREISLLTTDHIPDRERPRLWIDRSFSISGSGTVVTGTLVGGRLRVGEEVQLFPEKIGTRIRSLQTHEKSVDVALPGSRVAANLGGVATDSAPRGSMLGRKHQWELTKRFSAHLRTARYIDELAAKGAYQIHVGSSAHPMIFHGLTEHSAVIEIGHSVPLATGDHFIIRDTGRKLVVAGGTVADPSPGRTQQALALVSEIDALADHDKVADTLLRIRGTDRSARLAAHSGGGNPTSGVAIGDTHYSDEFLRKLSATLIEMVDDLYLAKPLRGGLDISTAASTLDIAPEVIPHIIESSDRLERRGPEVAAVGHRAELSGTFASAWEKAADTLSGDLAVPGVAQLDLDPELIHYLIRNDFLVRISEDLVYLPGQIQQIESAIKNMSSPFTVAQFRDATGLSRKYAVPILEWADINHLTRRNGDQRTVLSS